MSEKIVIEVDYKNMKKARTSVESLETSVQSARKTIRKFGSQKVTTEISADNTSVNLNIAPELKNVSALESRLNDLSQGNWNVKVTTVTPELDKPTSKASLKGESTGSPGDKKSVGGGFGGGMPTVVEVGSVEIKVKAKDGQNLVETIRDHKEEISEEIAGVFNAAFKGQFANTPASGGVSA